MPTEFSREREKLIMDMLWYSVYSEHLENFSINEIREKLEFFFDKNEIEIVVNKLKENESK